MLKTFWELNLILFFILSISVALLSKEDSEPSDFASMGLILCTINVDIFLTLLPPPCSSISIIPVLLNSSSWITVRESRSWSEIVFFFDSSFLSLALISTGSDLILLTLFINFDSYLLILLVNGYSSELLIKGMLSNNSVSSSSSRLTFLFEVLIFLLNWSFANSNAVCSSYKIMRLLNGDLRAIA